MPDPVEILRTVFTDYGRFCAARGESSETDVRSNILDRIIHEVLAWPRDSVKREPPIKDGYLDFELHTTKPILVIEAKREGISFVLPYVKSETARRLKISGVLSSNTKLIQAVEQTQHYCTEKGIRYGLVSNGYAYILFRAITEGSSWRTGQAIVFDSPKVLEKDFSTFWNLLNYQAIVDGKLEEAFRSSAPLTREFFKPITRAIDADALFSRNSLNVALRPYVERFFGDIASQNELELLEHCYVKSQPIQNIDQQIQYVLHDFIPKFGTSVEPLRPTPDNPGGQLASTLTKELSSQEKRGTVLLLMGGIGSGKTTFLIRFFTVVEPSLCSQTGKAMRLHLNFLGSPDRVEELDSFLWEKLAFLLKQESPQLNDRAFLEIIFSRELALINTVYSESGDRLEERLCNELYKLASNNRKLVENSLRFFSSQERKPIVIFDNVDQLALPLQTHLFTLAENFSNHLNCISIVSLREESYWTALMQRQLTAYAIRPFHLSSPSFKTLLRVRLDFATTEASKDKTIVDHNEFQFKSNKDHDIIAFFEVLRNSIFYANYSIIRLLEAVSFGNMRFALDLFNNFISSGATNIPKILFKFRAGGRYHIPFHEFAKSVILGDFKYYKEQRSHIANVFAVNTARNGSHFTGLRLLSMLSGNYQNDRDEDNFVSLQSVMGTMIDHFDNEEDCVKRIQSWLPLNRQLLELDTRRSDSFDGASELRVTLAGRYYLDYLVKDFAYLDLVWNDTAISDRAISDSLFSLIQSSSMLDRFERVEIFLEYLHKAEISELTELGLSTEGTHFYGPFMPDIISQFQQQRDTISRKLGLDREESWRASNWAQLDGLDVSEEVDPLNNAQSNDLQK